MKTNVYPCKPQFYYIKVRFKGVEIISACSRDAISNVVVHFSSLLCIGLEVEQL